MSYVGVDVDDFPHVSIVPAESARLEGSMRLVWLTTSSLTID